jgi:TolA-binding protein
LSEPYDPEEPAFGALKDIAKTLVDARKKTIAEHVAEIEKAQTEIAQLRDSAARDRDKIEQLEQINTRLETQRSLREADDSKELIALQNDADEAKAELLAAQKETLRLTELLRLRLDAERRSGESTDTEP